MTYYNNVIIIFIAFISFVIGIFLFIRPLLAIELQRRFYEKINWRIEPISLAKELKNTQHMGLLLIIIAFIGMVHLIREYVFYG